MNHRQRTVWIDLLSDAANIVLGGLFVGQFVSDRPFSLALAMAGSAGWVVLVALTTWLAKEGEEP